MCPRRITPFPRKNQLEGQSHGEVERLRILEVADVEESALARVVG